MADNYQTLIDMFGPGTGAIMAGQQYQMAQDAALQEQRKRLQDYEQTARMNPLEIQAKQANIAGAETENRRKLVDAIIAEQTQGNKIETSNLDLSQKRREDKVNKINTAATLLNAAVPRIANGGPNAASYAMQALQDAGFDPNDPKDSAAFKDILSQTSPQKMAERAGAWQKFLIQSSADYMKSMDIAKEHSRSAENVARIGAASREAAANARNKGTQSIDEQVRAGKMTAEKAAVAFYGAAEFEADPAERQRLLSMAQRYEQFAMQQRQAQMQGRPDVGAATGLPTTALPPALGGNSAPLGTAANPIKLK